MTVEAVVREWHDDEGWGVLDSPETPGGCWAHFSQVATRGYRTLSPGQTVALTCEVADQDGYHYRALQVWPVGTDPVEHPVDRAGTAYGSTLTVSFDDRTES